MKERNYIVVFKVGEHWVSPRNREEATGWAPDMIWLFGKPKSEEELELGLAVQAAAIIKRVRVVSYGISGDLQAVVHSRAEMEAVVEHNQKWAAAQPAAPPVRIDLRSTDPDGGNAR